MGKLLFRHLIFLGIAGCLTLSAFGQKHPVYPTIPPPPHTPQEILLLFSGNTADERILLTLNNNRPDVMTTSVTVYTSAGVSTALPDVQMIPQESKLIELSPLLQAAGLGHQELGWIKLNYSGVTLEMGAQLTLYPEKNGPGVDSPRSLSSDFKSTERDAVFWLPESGKARLALGNSSVGSIFVKMKCGTDTEELVIPAKTTKVRHLEPPNVGPMRLGQLEPWWHPAIQRPSDFTIRRQPRFRVLQQSGLRPRRRRMSRFTIFRLLPSSLCLFCVKLR
jgi:hypothetical protein